MYNKHLYTQYPSRKIFTMEFTRAAMKRTERILIYNDFLKHVEDLTNSVSQDSLLFNIGEKWGFKIYTEFTD